MVYTSGDCLASVRGIDMTSPTACYICFGMFVRVCVCTCELRQGQRVHTAAVSFYLLPPLHILLPPLIILHPSPSLSLVPSPFSPPRVPFIYFFFSPRPQVISQFFGLSERTVSLTHSHTLTHSLGLMCRLVHFVPACLYEAFPVL